MTKIEELIQKHVDPHVFIKGYGGLEDAMKEYAEYYTRKCLEIVAKEASADFECIGAVLGAENVYPFVDKDSILNIKLPEHE